MMSPRIQIQTLSFLSSASTALSFQLLHSSSKIYRLCLPLEPGIHNIYCRSKFFDGNNHAQLFHSTKLFLFDFDSFCLLQLSVMTSLLHVHRSITYNRTLLLQIHSSAPAGQSWTVSVPKYSLQPVYPHPDVSSILSILTTSLNFSGCPPTKLLCSGKRHRI